MGYSKMQKSEFRQTLQAFGEIWGSPTGLQGHQPINFEFPFIIKEQG